MRRFPTTNSLADGRDCDVAIARLPPYMFRVAFRRRLGIPGLINDVLSDPERGANRVWGEEARGLLRPGGGVSNGRRRRVRRRHGESATLARS